MNKNIFPCLEILYEGSCNKKQEISTIVRAFYMFEVRLITIVGHFRVNPESDSAQKIHGKSHFDMTNI